jgi:hypothetical protein
MKLCYPLAALVAAFALPAQSAIVLSFSTAGIVAPSNPAVCADPFAGCSLTAVGTSTATAGSPVPLPGPWAFTATFAIVAPLSATTFRTTGMFLFDDTSAANNDLSGSLEGVLDAVTFQNEMKYLVAGGSGLFANVSGSGNSVIQIVPQGPNQPFTFTESGQLAVPEPGALALALVALAGAGACTRRRPLQQERALLPRPGVAEGWGGV